MIGREAHDPIVVDGLKVEETPGATTPDQNLAPAIRASLNAKLERLLERPIIARIVDAELEVENTEVDDMPGVFSALQRAAVALAPAASTARRSAWRQDPVDGTCSVRIALDYDDHWRGKEKEILDTVANTVEGAITFLTGEQRMLLERSPREFLALDPRPDTAELISFERENIGGSVRVVELKFAAAPESRRHLHHLAIVPNLVQIERQLGALQRIESATDDSVLCPLRVLVGLCDASCLRASRPDDVDPVSPESDERLDEHQLDCLQKAMDTPHFAVIQGPPGSGKTTVISGIVRRAVARGQNVLVVSPTHVAVDNVVEKLAPRADSKVDDLLDARSLPVRYAARTSKLSEKALAYWVGSKKQKRGATIARRVQRRLVETIPFAEALFAMEDKDASGHAPLSAAVASVQPVICGTPIGILSFDTVKNAASGSFDLLIVDEVSKMTLPEFLAIAVKARRWVLVGDPQQLPPYNNSEENATTLDDVLDPLIELVCTVGAIIDRAKPAVRRDERLVVVSSEPQRAADALQAHFSAVWRDNLPGVALLSESKGGGIVVSSPDESDAACEFLSPVRNRDRGHNPENRGSVRVLVERGVALARPEFASGNRLVEARARAQAQIFDNSFNVYHARPWSERSGQKLAVVMFRNALDKVLPSAALLESLGSTTESVASPDERRRALIDHIAKRYAVNCVSVYDWLTGIPAEHLDVSPLRELGTLSPADLREKVRPFVGTLRKQYRMHSSLSRVPREVFYFNEALHDGMSDENAGCRVNLLQVEGDGDEGESNGREAATICKLIEALNGDDAAKERRPGIMIITPYRKQEALIERSIDELRARGAIGNLDVDVCTLDRCQGREAEYVLISLVRRRASTFLDMPKRWTVALTRAMQGLFIIGNIDAYLGEARMARQHPRAQPSAMAANSKQGRVLMSLLATIIEAYDRQIAASKRPRA
jgi:hypothetical protein